MSRVAPAVPAETDRLCEGCGYILNGLPESSNCPECGKPIAESADNLRTIPLWERPGEAGAVRRFLVTSGRVILHPARFYRSLATRGGRESSARFARMHHALTALFYAIAAWLHYDWAVGSLPGMRSGFVVRCGIVLALAIAAYAAIFLIVRLAATLTTWEATYRGYRLPLNAVRRGMDYHAAHYTPVALLAACTVIAFRLLLPHVPNTQAVWEQRYVWFLCAQVILSAIYLFQTYWIAMRNMMYAGR